MKKYFIFIFVMLLVGCSSDETQTTPEAPASEDTIGDGLPLETETVNVTVAEFVDTFNAHDQTLESVELEGENIFSMTLNGVEPDSFLLEGKQVFIYEFKNIGERESGWEEFQKKTATMNLVSHKKYDMFNLLIFYVHEQDRHESISIDEIMNRVSEDLVEKSKM